MLLAPLPISASCLQFDIPIRFAVSVGQFLAYLLWRRIWRLTGIAVLAAPVGYPFLLTWRAGARDAAKCALG